jgi:hypothetical protein
MYQFPAREVQGAPPRQVQHRLELTEKLFENYPRVVSVEPDILY